MSTERSPEMDEAQAMVERAFVELNEGDGPLDDDAYATFGYIASAWWPKIRAALRSLPKDAHAGRGWRPVSDEPPRWETIVLTDGGCTWTGYLAAVGFQPFGPVGTFGIPTHWHPLPPPPSVIPDPSEAP